MRPIFLIVVGFLLGYLLFSKIKGCVNDNQPVKSDTVYKKDTVWKHYDTVVKKPMRIKVFIHDTLPPRYIPHPGYDSLKMQYEELAQAFVTKNIYEDTFSLGKIGQVIVYDTVQTNQLGHRSYMADYIIPIIRDTIYRINIIEAPKKGQLYVGGGFATNKALNNTANVGILYKTKKDKILGGYVAIMPGMQVSYGIQSYWKLTFKK